MSLSRSLFSLVLCTASLATGAAFAQDDSTAAAVGRGATSVVVKIDEGPKKLESLAELAHLARSAADEVAASRKKLVGAKEAAKSPTPEKVANLMLTLAENRALEATVRKGLATAAERVLGQLGEIRGTLTNYDDEIGKHIESEKGVKIRAQTRLAELSSNVRDLSGRLRRVGITADDVPDEALAAAAVLQRAIETEKSTSELSEAHRESLIRSRDGLRNLRKRVDHLRRKIEHMRTAFVVAAERDARFARVLLVKCQTRQKLYETESYVKRFEGVGKQIDELVSVMGEDMSLPEFGDVEIGSVTSSSADRDLAKWLFEQADEAEEAPVEPLAVDAKRPSSETKDSKKEEISR